ncbi:MAG: flagellar assembly protein FliW [Myxococcales bacterium]|nr:flagellar assembly protein FliW [Myxococcales bacterium]
MKTLKVNTTRFGEVDVSEERLILAPKGLLGFRGQTQWCLLHDERNPVVWWLQSVDNPDLAMMIADPDVIFEDFLVTVSPEDLEDLRMSDADRFGDGDSVGHGGRHPTRGR